VSGRERVETAEALAERVTADGRKWGQWVAFDAIRADRAAIVARMTHLTTTKGYDHEEAWTIVAAELLGGGK
jgi:hypothetical protein